MNESLKSFIKRLETLNKRFLFRFVLRFIFRNRQSQKPLSLKDSQHVLILRNDVIGDMVITTAFINFLLDIHPTLNISVVTSSHAEPVLRYDTRLHRVFILERAFSSFLSLLKQARNKYDITFALSLNGISRDAILANLLAPSSVKVTYDIGWPEDREYYRYLFNKQINVGHEEWPLWKKLIALGKEVFNEDYNEESIRQTLFYPSEIEREVHSFLTELKIDQKSFLLFNLSARLDYKKWGEKNNVEFLKIFRIRFPSIPIIITCAPEDREESLRLSQSSGFNNLYSTPVSFGLHHVMAITKAASVVFSPDTAVVHFAATFSTPSFIICTALASHPVWEPCSKEFKNHFTPGVAPVSELIPQNVFDDFQLFLIEKRIFPV